jgi:hypothetical protein
MLLLLPPPPTATLQVPDMAKLDVDIRQTVTWNFLAQLALTAISWAIAFFTSHTTMAKVTAGLIHGKGGPQGGEWGDALGEGHFLGAKGRVSNAYLGLLLVCSNRLGSLPFGSPAFWCAPRTINSSVGCLVSLSYSPATPAFQFSCRKNQTPCHF